MPDPSDPSAEPAAARPRGRPGRRTPELTAKICDAIEAFGHTLTHAGLLAGVPRSTTARWKDEDEDFGDEVETARARFLQERMINALSKTHPDGQKDWRAQKWAHEQGMKHSLDAPPPLPRGRRPPPPSEKRAEPPPVRYGPKPGDGGRCLYDGHGEPVEWTRPPGVPLDDDRYLPDGSLIMTEEILSQMQDMRERELKAYWEEGPDGPTGQRWDAALAEALAQNAPPYDTDHDHDNTPKSSENSAGGGSGDGHRRDGSRGKHGGDGRNKPHSAPLLPPLPKTPAHPAPATLKRVPKIPRLIPKPSASEPPNSARASCRRSSSEWSASFRTTSQSRRTPPRPTPTTRRGCTPGDAAGDPSEQQSSDQ